jgi:hypothetical protein
VLRFAELILDVGDQSFVFVLPLRRILDSSRDPMPSP